MTGTCCVVLLLPNHHHHQVFWGWLILRVLYKLVRDGHVEDNRSDDDEPSDETELPKKRDRKKVQ